MIRLSVLLVGSQQEVCVYTTAILVPYKMVAGMELCPQGKGSLLNDGNNNDKRPTETSLMP